MIKQLCIRFMSVLLAVTMLLTGAYPCKTYAAGKRKHKIVNQWSGRRVAFLGDSITDKRHIGTTKNYWQYLQEMLEIIPLVYGVNGHQWSDILSQAQLLKKEHADDVDAIVVFAGTNDYNASVPIGEWSVCTEQSVAVSGGATEFRYRRTPIMSAATFKGRINMAMSFLKDNFPTAQIILLTPLHRAYAEFGKDNIQIDETYGNAAGLYIDDYVRAVKEAAGVWAVPVIDMNSLSGLYPLCDSHADYFHDSRTDLLHPNAEGHYRMAKTLKYQLSALPSNFAY